MHVSASTKLALRINSRFKHGRPSGATPETSAPWRGARGEEGNMCNNSAHGRPGGSQQQNNKQSNVCRSLAGFIVHGWAPLRHTMKTSKKEPKGCRNISGRTFSRHMSSIPSQLCLCGLDEPGRHFLDYIPDTASIPVRLANRFRQDWKTGEVTKTEKPNRNQAGSQVGALRVEHFLEWTTRYCFHHRR